MHKRILTFVVLVTIVVGSAACSDKKDDTAKDKAVTTEQAQILSRVLFENTEAQNATFVLTSGNVPDGFIARGKVDWVKGVVSLIVSLRNASEPDISVVVTKTEVYESVPGLNAAETQQGIEPREWVLRTFDPTKYGIDSVANFIIKLAATAPDNSILIKQNGAQFLGTETIDGDKTFKLTNNGSVVYFATKDSVLKKLTATVKGFDHDFSVVFTDRSTTTIDVPTPADAQPFDVVSGFYSTLRPAF